MITGAAMEYFIIGDKNGHRTINIYVIIIPEAKISYLSSSTVYNISLFLTNCLGLSDSVSLIQENNSVVNIISTATIIWISRILIFLL